MKWIATSDQLPTEDDGTVAVLTRDRQILTAWATYWRGAGKGFAGWHFPHGDKKDGVEVTHWCRLPSIRRFLK